MLGDPGLRLHAGPGRRASPRADQPGGPDEQRQGVLGGGQPRGQQVQIDVEERHGGGAAHPVQHRLGADQDGGVGEGRLRPGRTRAGHLPHVRAEERRQFLAQTAHADPHGLHAQPAARRAHHRTGLVAARAPQHLLPTRLRRSRAAAGTAGQLAAVTTGQQAGAAGAVVDADQRAPLARRRIVEDGPGEADELLGEHAAARVGAATVDPFQDGPARPLLQARRSHRPQPGAGGERHRGHGRHEDAGNALATRPLDQDVDRAVGGGALLPVGRVVRIENDRGRQRGHRGPGAGPVADHDGPPGACVLPAPRGRPAPPCQPRRQPFGPARRRDEHQHAAGAGAHAGVPHHGEHEFDRIGQRRLAHDGEPRLGQVEIVGPRCVGARRRAPCGRRRQCRQRTHNGVRRRAAEEERGRSGPTPGGPLRQVNESGRRSPAQPRLQRQDVDAFGRPRLLVDHPPPHRPPVEGSAHARADLHVVAPRRRHGVVERLGHGGHLGTHAHHAASRRRSHRAAS